MTRRELIAVWIAAGLMALMLLVPPWVVRQDVRSIKGEHLSSSENVEYAFLLSPPKRYSTSVTPAEGLLLVQWGGVAIVLAAVLVTFRANAAGRKR
ncbi:MAG: hypothetical protein L6Q95_05290 [Planctomycetes bacterium]|nr:hypothetical protein [Planctomycetota bacterium]